MDQQRTYDAELGSLDQPSSEERTWALVAHLGGPVGLLLSAFLLGFLVPLVVWLAKKDHSRFVGDQACEALNFQITLLLVHVALFLFVFATLGIGLIVALPAFAALWVVEVVLGVVAALQAYDGKRYRYPFSLRLVS